MPRNSLFLWGFLLLAAGCGAGDLDQSPEWKKVVAHKEAAARPDATVRDKQAYADALAAFVRTNPEHSTARDIYRRIQIEFADDLVAIGRYQQAVRMYRAVLSNDPANRRAEIGLRDAMERLTVSKEKLAKLEKGMSRNDVSGILGKPLPGWTVARERGGIEMEAWYYRTPNGLAGIYFREGKLFAAEENSEQRVGRWNG